MNHGDRLGSGRVLGIGLAGGTSADGLDAALVAFTPRAGDPTTRPPQIELLAWHCEPLTGATDRALIAELATGSASSLAICDRSLGLRFAAAARALDWHVHGTPCFAGCGGQTAAHHGPRGTLQLGSPAELAEALGVPVVAGFRTSDVAAGGQGAPLAPALDWALFADEPGIVALNLGGIANITWIAADPSHLMACDCGPANALIDRCARWASDGRLDCDRDGQLAAAGREHTALLAWLLEDPYLTQPPPRSTGLERYGDARFAEIRQRWPQVAAVDLARTLTRFSARAVALTVQMLPAVPRRVVVSGGGTHNPLLLAMLREELAPSPVAALPGAGWTDAKEAVLFAWLAYLTLRGRPAPVAAATGARGPRVLGAIWHSRSQ
jgi:anhydro-N-acetylmuramic acid kinase